jgi:hypothetical protein
VTGSQRRPPSLVTTTNGSQLSAFPGSRYPTATQCVSVGQAMALKAWPSGVLSTRVHVAPPSELAMIHPGPPISALPTAKHRVSLGQTTSVRLPTPAGTDRLVHAAPTGVAVVDVVVVDGAGEVEDVVPPAVEVLEFDATPSARGDWLPQADRTDRAATAIIGPTVPGRTRRPAGHVLPGPCRLPLTTKWRTFTLSPRMDEAFR